MIEFEKKFPYSLLANQGGFIQSLAACYGKPFHLYVLSFCGVFRWGL